MNDETKIEETDGYIIIHDISETASKPKPKSRNDAEPAKQVPDSLLSAISQIEFTTHILAPEYVNGKTTGQWRVYFFRNTHGVLANPLEIPWDRQFESRGEAETWISEILKQLESIGDHLPE